MSVASLIERLKLAQTHQTHHEKPAGVLAKNEAFRGENGANTPNTPNTPENAGGQSANQKTEKNFKISAPPTPAPDPGMAPLPMPTGEPGCSNCEAATTKQWHGGYTMHCIGCMARLVASARPSHQQQETMLACLELRSGGRPERPTRQQVLERLQRR